MKEHLRRSLTILVVALAAQGCSKLDDTPPVRAKYTLQAAEKWTGEAIFIERCRDCHQVHETGGVVGPDLSAVGANRTRFFIEQVLRHPSRQYPGTVMPPYDTLPAGQLGLLADYLETLK